jgi:ubiquitin C-terminal hydrolase
MNATLQALIGSDILSNCLLLFVKKYNCMDQLDPCLLAYIRVILETRGQNAGNQNAGNQNAGNQNAGNQIPYNPREFKLTLDRQKRQFRGSAQHDANELLVCLINEFVDGSKDAKMQGLIKSICFGKYRQYVCCDECKHISESYFSFFDVVLPIPVASPMARSVTPLEACFAMFAQCEVLDGSNSWLCDQCKKKVTAHKKMEIKQVPDLAVFTLNRFRGAVKNTQPVQIYKQIELDGKKLKLISTVNHYGGVGGGHYVAHVLDAGQWYRVDDSAVSRVDINTILCDPSVYMMMYQLDV